jgi:hypothetical protein
LSRLGRLNPLNPRYISGRPKGKNGDRCNHAGFNFQIISGQTFLIWQDIAFPLSEELRIGDWFGFSKNTEGPCLLDFALRGDLLLISNKDWYVVQGLVFLGT